ncbi:hypothetical protein B0T10DRAFT_43692 [Thelonectria olida]|uniref:C2H2 type master regulator of conidiophore development brlA n=1 Tax=Thelonectria olida TaxID=1576542 RepID=A0A9P8W5R3_9HYPO|nr:hypothetical protein B0T10DRAFT_43692 [Thelonectria olida]
MRLSSKSAHSSSSMTPLATPSNVHTMSHTRVIEDSNIDSFKLANIHGQSEAIDGWTPQDRQNGYRLIAFDCQASLNPKVGGREVLISFSPTPTELPKRPESFILCILLKGHFYISSDHVIRIISQLPKYRIPVRKILQLCISTRIPENITGPISRLTKQTSSATSKLLRWADLPYALRKALNVQGSNPATPITSRASSPVNENSYPGTTPFGPLAASAVNEDSCPDATPVITRHERTHTGEKPYECNDCDKKFTRPGHLTSHKRTHTGEKPYKCNSCGKKFAQRGVLTRHERIHTGEKPYVCHACHWAFTQQSHLTDHQRTHTGEKPYVCDFPNCNKAFGRRTLLTRHTRCHTKERLRCQ